MRMSFLPSPVVRPIMGAILDFHLVMFWDVDQWMWNRWKYIIDIEQTKSKSNKSIPEWKACLRSESNLQLATPELMAPL